MSLTVSLSQSAVSAPPGEQVLLQVGVRNTGHVVDRFTVSVLGDAARWATVEPPSINLNPGTEGEVFVRFDIPRASEVASGQVPFAVKVTSQEDPAGSIVEEGVLNVGAFAEVVAELLPRTGRGRRRTRHQLAIDNRGNTRLNVDLGARDPDGLLAFRITPPALVAAPATASFADVVVQARRPFLRGPAQSHPFQVTVTAEDQPPLVLDGTMLQESRLPAWTLRAALAALALLLALVLLWLVVLKPTVRSTAKDAIREPLGRTNEAVNDIGAAVGRNPNLATSGDAVTDAEPGQASTTTTAPVGAGGAIATNFGNPFDLRLEVGGTTSFRIPDGNVFSLTDVVLQNPAGDSGTISLMRGDRVLFRDALANFRSVDFHFVAPIVFDAGTAVVLQVDCRNTGTACTAAAQLGGFMKAKG